MNVKLKMKMRLSTFRQIEYINKICGNKKLTGFYEGEIIRNVHSIEKGISLKNPRLFFGISKIIKMLDLIMEYVKKQEYSMDIVNMALDAVDAYKEYHKDVLDDPKLKIIISKHNTLRNLYPKKDYLSAGILRIKRQVDEKQFDSLQNLVMQRHSVRDFSKESVPIDSLHKACDLALHAPSACNRQGTRIYILTGAHKKGLENWLSGIGGFAEEVDKYIIVTAKVSVYRFEEACQFQYVVSSSILVGYLSLTLQSLGIGACLIQRPLVRTREWKALSKKLSIPVDEQIVLMLGVGMLKEQYNVPVSNRMPYEMLVKEF